MERTIVSIVAPIFLFATALAVAALPVWVLTNDGFTWRAMELALVQTPVALLLAYAGRQACRP